MVSEIEVSTHQNKGFLTGRLLLATPAIQGSCFERSVIYLCAHNETGAMGIIVNYPVENLQLKEILGQLGIDMQPMAREFPVHFGGPVEANRGFVVHSGEIKPREALIAEGGIAVTASISVLQDLAAGRGPQQGMLVLGYAGWAPGQLENEIETGSWMVAPATKQLVFDTGNEMKWNLAISSIGVDLGHLSTDVGHA